MKFNENTIEDAKKHAIEEYPRESCGLVISGKYLKCKNIAEDPLNKFEIDQEIIRKHRISRTLEGVIHSHIDGKFASEEDMKCQISNNVPWMIINMKHKDVVGAYAWGGDYDTPDLIGREFVHGITDCFALVRDYYKKEKNIVLKNFPRDPQWWRKGRTTISDFFEESGFEWMDGDKDLKKGDGVILAIRSKTPNHTGVYLGDGTFIHHLENRYSKREPIYPWLKYICGYGRYKK